MLENYCAILACKSFITAFFLFEYFIQDFLTIFFFEKIP